MAALLRIWPPWSWVMPCSEAGPLCPSQRIPGWGWQQLDSSAVPPMATPDPAVLVALAAQCRNSSQPQGLIFLGQAQLQDGGTPEPPPSGGVTAVQALAPLVSVTAGDGVVVLALDLRMLSSLPP